MPTLWQSVVPKIWDASEITSARKVFIISYLKIERAGVPRIDIVPNFHH